MDDLSSSADQSQPPHACSQENGKILTKQLFDLLTNKHEKRQSAFDLVKNCISGKVVLKLTK